MSFDYIRQTYRVPAKFGGRVQYTGNGKAQIGTITGVDGAHLLIKLDDEKGSRRFHPTWEISYLSEQEGGAA